MKLEIELVPSTCWYSNVRSNVSKETWDRIRKWTYKNYNHKCGICDTGGMIHCHEIWEYNDKKCTQKLKGFIALCPMCHHVKHIGLAEILSDNKKLNIQDVIDHFMKVNDCSYNSYRKHYDKAWSTWERQSMHEWIPDLSDFIKESSLVR